MAVSVQGEQMVEARRELRGFQVDNRGPPADNRVLVAVEEGTQPVHPAPQQHYALGAPAQVRRERSAEGGQERDPETRQVEGQTVLSVVAFFLSRPVLVKSPETLPARGQ